MAKKAVEPIMSEDAERFMAFAGVIQWAYAVVEQGKRIEAAVRERIGARGGNRAITLRCQIQTECHLFVIAAWQMIKHREWAGRLGLFDLRGCSNETELSLLLQLDAIESGRFRFGRGSQQVPIGQRPSARRMQNHSILDGAGRRVDFPTPGRRRDQHEARRGTSSPKG